jgi:hypothetical protein
MGYISELHAEFVDEYGSEPEEGGRYEYYERCAACRTLSEARWNGGACENPACPRNAPVSRSGPRLDTWAALLAPATVTT